MLSMSTYTRANAGDVLRVMARVGWNALGVLIISG